MGMSVCGVGECVCGGEQWYQNWLLKSGRCVK